MDLVHFLQAAALLALLALAAAMHGRLRQQAAQLSLLAQVQEDRFHQLQAAALQTRDALAAFAAAQEQQNRATLMAALGEVIDDFHRRINGQFRAQLAELAQQAGATAAMHDKHRAQQGEMMHHARRSAGEMSATLEAFRELVAHTAGLSSIGEQVRQALALLGPQQQAIQTQLAALGQELGHAGNGIGQLQEHGDDILEELTGRTRRLLEGLSQRAGQQANDMCAAVQRAAEQHRSQLAEAAGKSQQHIAAVHKDLDDTMEKTLATLTKQLAATSTRLSGEIAPMAQQIKRVAEQSRVNRP